MPNVQDPNNPLLYENRADYLLGSGKVKVTDNGILYDVNNVDSFIDAMNQSNAYARDDSYYQRTFADLKKAGINPAVLLASGSGISGVNSASTYKNSNVNEDERKRYKDKMTNYTNSAKIVGAIAAVLGAIAALA